MTAQRPNFRVVKNGYDRFAVDDAVDEYASQIEQLQKKLELYRQQLVETVMEMDDLKLRYQKVLNEDQSRKEAAESIARLSLKEANTIISTAQKNADQIVQEAILTARGILLDLSKLYDQADDAKGDMKENLEGLMKDLDEFEIPKMPDLKWLQDIGKDICDE